MDLMQQIQSGMFDDIINSTVKERDEKLAKAGSPEFLDWLYDTVLKSRMVSDEDINSLNEKDKENVALLQYLKSYLIEYYDAKLHNKSDDYGFSYDTLNFSYRHKYFKITTIISENTITEVTLLEKKPKTCVIID